jgi:hypothetical protein
MLYTKRIIMMRRESRIPGCMDSSSPVASPVPRDRGPAAPLTSLSVVIWPKGVTVQPRARAFGEDRSLVRRSPVQRGETVGIMATQLPAGAFLIHAEHADAVRRCPPQDRPGRRRVREADRDDRWFERHRSERADRDADRRAVDDSGDRHDTGGKRGEDPTQLAWMQRLSQAQRWLTAAGTAPHYSSNLASASGLPAAGGSGKCPRRRHSCARSW